MKRPNIQHELHLLWLEMDIDSLSGRPWSAMEKARAERKLLRRGKWRSFWYGFTHPFESL